MTETELTAAMQDGDDLRSLKDRTPASAAAGPAGADTLPPENLTEGYSEEALKLMPADNADTPDEAAEGEAPVEAAHEPADAATLEQAPAAEAASTAEKTQGAPESAEAQNTPPTASATAEAPAPAAAPAHENPTTDSTRAMLDRFRTDLADLRRRYPESLSAEGETLPGEVLEAYLSGGNLEAAWLGYRHKEQAATIAALRSELAVLKQNNNAARRAPITTGVAATAGLDSRENPITRGYSW